MNVSYEPVSADGELAQQEAVTRRANVVQARLLVYGLLGEWQALNHILNQTEVALTEWDAALGHETGDMSLAEVRELLNLFEKEGAL